MDIKELSDFIPHDKCDDLVDFLSKKNVFNNQQLMKALSITVTDDTHEVIAYIRNKICELLDVPLKNLEHLMISRYVEGGEYPHHYDSFFIQPNSIYTKEFYESNMNEGGQRMKTCVIYLNDDFKGGHTFFGRIYNSIQPEKGKLAYWANANEYGDTYVWSEHMGMKVESGTKWIAVCYIREKEYTGNSVTVCD